MAAFLLPTTPFSHLEPSPFFRLSPEIRLVIYEYVLPPDGQLYIDLCTPTLPAGEEFVLGKRSIVSTLLKRVMDLGAIVRGGGLQLLLVSRRIHSEIFPLLSSLTTRFHCHKCFDELLPQISHGLGVGIQWMRHVEIILDLEAQMKQGQTLTMELARAMARETMALAQKRAWLYYGRLDLRGRERWRYEPLVEGGRGKQRNRGEGDDRSHDVGNPLTGGMQSTWQQVGGGVNTGMYMHAMANGMVVPGRWLISGWFDI